jgi:hypothetical protein
MNKPIAPEPSIAPSDDEFDETEPQNEEERELYDLLMEGINSGLSEVTSIDELSAKLLAQIRATR